MTHWARQARNKAMGDKRKAAKQGSALVSWMREQDELKRKDKLQIQEGMEGVPRENAETPGSEV